MMSDKLKNSSFITAAGHFSSTVKNLSSLNILVIVLLVLLEISTVTVIAAPLNLDDEWTAVIVPITWSPAVVTTTNKGQTSTQLELFQKWWNSISADYSNRNKFARTIASPRYSTCRGLSCHGMNFGKSHDGKSYNDEKQSGKNRRVENEFGKNYHDKHCGENQHQKHCSKKQCDKPYGKIHHEQHCARTRNGEGRHSINDNKQNKQQNTRNRNRHKEVIVDNKVIVNINNDRTLSPTTPTLRAETVVPVLVSTTQESVIFGLNNCCFFSWIINMCIPINCILVCFLIFLCFLCM